MTLLSLILVGTSCNDEWKDEQWIPLNSADATTIIGLTYENFRRTIIIPQGKFNEFLGLKGKERSDMMKEIFHLKI